MPKQSAGLLLYRLKDGVTEILLGHPGGPFWARKDAGSWSIPKGEYQPDEEPLAAARREFAEETGHAAPDGPVVGLGQVRQGSGKIVTAFAVAGDFDPAKLDPGLIEIEWPPRSGQRRAVPEIDRVAWFTLGAAQEKLLPAQRAFIDRLEAALSP
jgi:predicted NUDIX family NTP pyrophosphohydrolase